MSKQTKTAQKPIADTAMTRGYLIVLNIEHHTDNEVDYILLANNGGRTVLTDQAMWLDSVSDAISEIYKRDIKPTYHNGEIYPKVVKACVRLVVEQVAFECVISNGEEV
jgi:hypothetical protein